MCPVILSSAIQYIACNNYIHFNFKIVLYLLLYNFLVDPKVSDSNAWKLCHEIYTSYKRFDSWSSQRDFSYRMKTWLSDSVKNETRLKNRPKKVKSRSKIARRETFYKSWTCLNEPVMDNICKNETRSRNPGGRELGINSLYSCLKFIYQQNIYIYRYSKYIYNYHHVVEQ